MAKILIFDIETAPIRAYVWRMWKETIGFNQIHDDWYMLTWAAKWLGEEDMYFDSNHLHGDCNDDTEIAKSLHAMIDEADIIVAHNAKKFDIKKMNTRFMAAGLSPPSPYRVVDTLEEARKHFAFTSNRLDALGKILGVGEKVDTGGFDLWWRCMEGDEEAFEEMVYYNIGDIELLEKVYLLLRPWMKNHPNIGVYDDDETVSCPKCGGTTLQWRGYATTQAGRFHRFQCQSCGGWGRSRYSVLGVDKKKAVAANIQ